MNLVPLEPEKPEFAVEAIADVPHNCRIESDETDCALTTLQKLSLKEKNTNENKKKRALTLKLSYTLI